MSKKHTRNQNGTVTGIVKVTLQEVINTDAEGFLDRLGEELVGSSLLMDISYEVVGNNGNTLLIQVTGDPSECSLGK
jgi:hypothetical protein